MSLKAKQLRKIQEGLSPLLLQRQVEMAYECVTALASYPGWHEALTSAEKKLLADAFVRVHPLLSLALDDGLLDGVPLHRTQDLWQALVDLDARRGAEFICPLDNGNWGVDLESVKQAVEELRVQYQEP
jgi:hypothetical protein